MSMLMFLKPVVLVYQGSHRGRRGGGLFFLKNFKSPLFIIANASIGVPSPLSPPPYFKMKTPPAPPNWKPNPSPLKNQERVLLIKQHWKMEKGGRNSNKNVILLLRAFKVSKEKETMNEVQFNSLYNNVVLFIKYFWRKSVLWDKKEKHLTRLISDQGWIRKVKMSKNEQ